MADLVITSAANPRLKHVLALRRRRVRDEAGETLVEGFDELALALSAGHPPRTLFVCPDLFSPAGYAGPSDAGSHEDLVTAARDPGSPDLTRPDDLVTAARAAGAQIVRLGRAAFEKVAYREGPDGLLGVVPAVDQDLATLRPPPDALVLVAQGVEKPGNLGAMLRTADAVGATAVVSVDPVTDWGNPNVVRASKGAVFTVPVSTGDVGATIGWCRAHRLRLVVAAPDGDERHTDVDYTGGCAVAVGAEKLGATGALLDAADHRVHIPMRGRVNSLNVATAAAVVLYEAVRQRTSKRLHC
jgi:TrmH family RNA methyltransferase